MSTKTKVTPMTEQEREVWSAELQKLSPEDLQFVREYVKFLVKKNQARAKAPARRTSKKK